MAAASTAAITRATASTSRNHWTVAMMVEPILLYTTLSVPHKIGIAATPAAAIMPAANAYSTKSCPRQSGQTFNLQTSFDSAFTDSIVAFCERWRSIPLY
jgi:hypothetical protein